MKENLRRKWHQPAFQELFPDPKEHGVQQESYS